MSNKVHVHDVLNMMSQSAEQYSTDSLVAAMQRTFGDDAQYRSCSQQGMDAAQAVAFLKGKGKFTGDDNSFTRKAGDTCSHR